MHPWGEAAGMEVGITADLRVGEQIAPSGLVCWGEVVCNAADLFLPNPSGNDASTLLKANSRYSVLGNTQAP